MARSRDGCAVPTAELAHEVAAFVRRWQRDRPETTSRLAGTAASQGSVLPITAYEWLEQETAIPGAYIEGIVRSLDPDRKVRVAGHVELQLADRLLAAIGRPQAYHDGAITVVENPYASRKARDACCGGLAA